MMKKALFATMCFSAVWVMAQPLQKVELGQMLFFDSALSKNRSQSCATCHDPGHAFSDGRDSPSLGAASLGDDGHSFGNRNAPTAAYAQLSPVFHYDRKNKVYKGGQFWDGRAATLAEQAGGPPLNPVEMGMKDEATVVARLQENPTYVETFKHHYGKDIWQDSKKVYLAMSDAIQAFEQTELFAPFDSKYDRFLRGEYELTPLEDLGRTLFFSNNNTNCSTCHKLKNEDDAGEPFTDFLYHNIGVPRNVQLMALNKLPKDFVDRGLLENPAVKEKSEIGKFKTPTLRNIAVTAPYMHNGVFKDLRTVIEFYDKYNNPQRKVNPETGKEWGKPEIAETIDFEKLKAQKLTERKIDALVAFLKLLTDERYEPLLDKTTPSPKVKP